MAEYTWQEAEKQARSWALRAFFTRNVGRLFPLPELDLTTERAREHAEDQFWGKPVAVLSHGSERPIVGTFFGFADGAFSGNFLYAVEYVVTHFSGVGQLNARSPGQHHRHRAATRRLRRCGSRSRTMTDG